MTSGHSGSNRYATNHNIIFTEGYTMKVQILNPGALFLVGLAISAMGIRALAADPMAESQLQMAGKAKPASQATNASALAKVNADVFATKTSKAYLHCMVRISKSGKATLLHATEVEGEALMPEETSGSFLYEVYKGSTLVGSQGIADPFERRAFAGPKNSKQEGHHFESNEEADVIVKIPGAKLSDTDLEQLALTFYQSEDNNHIEKLDAVALQDLKAKHKLRRLSEIPFKSLGDEIKSRSQPLKP
jgi:hypothetical protein